MSIQPSNAPRQHLNPRQAETVDKLMAATTELLDEVGHEQVTVRMVAARAGVSPATAYTYVASKEHLFAEVFWRLLLAEGQPELTGRKATTRLQQTVRRIAEIVAAAPAIAAAANASMLTSDPEVERIRLMIGAHWVSLFSVAIGEDKPVSPEVLNTLAFAISGALLTAGTGVFSYERLAEHLVNAVTVIMRGVE